MLAHFQEEEAAGRARGVLGDETIITSVTLRTRSFFFLAFSYSLLCGARLLRLRCILFFFCNFCLIPNRSFLVLYLVYTSLGFHCLCVICYTLLFSLPFVFQLGCWLFGFLYPVVSFSRFLLLHTSISPSTYCYHTSYVFFITLLFVFYVFSLSFFALLWRTWEGFIHLFYNMGNGSEQEVLGDFKAGNGHFVYLRISRVFVFLISFFYGFLIVGAAGIPLLPLN